METALNKIRVNRYPAYKDSGVEWLGEIPVHWDIEIGKWLFKKEERPTRPFDDIVTCFRDGQVTLRSNRRVDGFTNAIYEYGYQGIRRGDFVIHSMDAFSGAIGVSDSDGKSSPVYLVCTPRNSELINSYYYAFYLRQLALSGFIESLAKGIRERSTDFRFSDFSKIKLPLPPVKDQNSVVKFLTQKTTQIDKAIAQKERVIELLKEKRQILIQRAVTRGLDPNVKMKDSGVEWIGEIPEHWEVKRLKDICSINLDSLHETTRSDFSFKYVDISSVTYETGIFQTEEYTFKNAPSRARRIARKGDTIISTVRTYLKAIDYINEEKSTSIYSTGFAVLHPKELMHSEFLATFVKSNAFTEQVIVNSKGMSYPAINSSELGRLYIVHGNIDEQQAIVKYINERSSRIFHYISIKESEIDKLKEFKATLINSVVTGKIKV